MHYFKRKTRASSADITINKKVYSNVNKPLNMTISKVTAL